MPRLTPLHFQALTLFIGVTCLYASFSPFEIEQMGYTGEEMRACRQLLGSEGPPTVVDWPRLPHTAGGAGVDWPRNGLTFVLVDCPFIALGRAVGRGNPVWEDRVLAMSPVLATAALVTVLFVWASRLAESHRIGFWLAMAAAFSTMLWPYAYIGMETTGSLFLLIAGYLALTASSPPSTPRTIAFAACGAIAVSGKSGGFALLPVVAYLGWIMLRRQPARLLVVGAGIAASFAANQYFRALSWVRFGGATFWARSWRPHDPIASLAGLAALLFSPTKGLLVFAPLAVAGLVLLHRCFRSEPRVAVFALLTLAGLLALMSQLRIWADEAWGPRYLHVTVAPLLVCLAPVLRGRPFSGFLRGALVSAAAVGLAVSFLGAMFYYGALWNVAIRTAPLSLQALQGDPTWNHVDFNARLLATWRESRETGTPPRYLPRPDKWDYLSERPIAWTDVDLTPWAVPQPVLFRSFPPPIPLRKRLCEIALIIGLLLVTATGRTSAIVDSGLPRGEPGDSAFHAA